MSIFREFLDGFRRVNPNDSPNHAPVQDRPAVHNEDDIERPASSVQESAPHLNIEHLASMLNDLSPKEKETYFYFLRFQYQDQYKQEGIKKYNEFVLKLYENGLRISEAAIKKLLISSKKPDTTNPITKIDPNNIPLRGTPKNRRAA